MTLSNPNLPSAERLELSLTASSQPPISDAEMRQAVRTLLIGLGEDPDREGLLTTFYPS
jgi:GTP cyclohydrolase IA